jgi:epoxyqueuosine reductase
MTPAAWQQALQAFVADNPDILSFGCVEPGPAPSEARLRRFLAQGHAADMEYMARQVEERVNPSLLAPWAKTLVLMSLKPTAPLQASTPPYAVAAYARGEDYHHRARRLLQALESHLRTFDGELQFRGFVDTSPLFERDFAAAAGLGWRAKNCTLLSREHGSHFLLFGCLLSVETVRSQPVAEFCGGCTRCLDACPTSAFTAPGELDARLCISYHTIENRGQTPPELASRFGSWIFGCDICQTVCPWNRKHLQADQGGKGKPGNPGDQGDPGTLKTSDNREAGSSDPYTLTGSEWLNLLSPGGGFQSRFKGSPLSRAGRKGMLRNVAEAAARQGDASALPGLLAALERESDTMLQATLQKTVAQLEGRIRYSADPVGSDSVGSDSADSGPVGSGASTSSEESP